MMERPFFSGWAAVRQDFFKIKKDKYSFALPKASLKIRRKRRFGRKKFRKMPPNWVPNNNLIRNGKYRQSVMALIQPRLSS